MKARVFIAVMVMAAFLAGFLVGWQRAISLIGCPQPESERLVTQMEETHKRIKQANQKNSEIVKQHPEGRQK